MELSVKLLGHYMVEKLQDQARRPVLQLGKDRFTKEDLSKERCFNFGAATNLSNILNKKFRVKDTRDVFERIHPHELMVPRLGATSFATLGAAFELKLGKTLSDYTAYHRDANAKEESFDSMKHREMKDIREEEARKKKRKAERRDVAHATRVERFVTRETVNDGS